MIWFVYINIKISYINNKHLIGNTPYEVFLYMNKQEYQHVRNLAWNVLLDGQIGKLPIDIIPISKLYHSENLVDNSKSLYENVSTVSTQILKTYGYNTELNKYLAIRIMSPMIILKELKIQSVEDTARFTKLPLYFAKQRFERYQMLLVRNAFETSSLETKVLNQFQNWLSQYV